MDLYLGPQIIFIKKHVSIFGGEILVNTAFIDHLNLNELSTDMTQYDNIPLIRPL